MPGRVSPLYGSVSRTGTDERYVPLDPTVLSFLKDRVCWLSVNVCAGFILGNGVFFLILCAPRGFVHVDVLALLVYTPSCPQDLGYAGVPIADWFPLTCAWTIGKGSLDYNAVVLYVPAFVRLPSLHGYDAYSVY